MQVQPTCCAPPFSFTATAPGGLSSPGPPGSTPAPAAAAAAGGVGFVRGNRLGPLGRGRGAGVGFVRGNRLGSPGESPGAGVGFVRGNRPGSPGEARGAGVGFVRGRRDGSNRLRSGRGKLATGDPNICRKYLTEQWLRQTAAPPLRSLPAWGREETMNPTACAVGPLSPHQGTQFQGLPPSPDQASRHISAGPTAPPVMSSSSSCSEIKILGL